jgi:hypothetical protein
MQATLRVRGVHERVARASASHTANQKGTHRRHSGYSSVACSSTTSASSCWTARPGAGKGGKQDATARQHVAARARAERARHTKHTPQTHTHRIVRPHSTAGTPLARWAAWRAASPARPAPATAAGARPASLRCRCSRCRHRAAPHAAVAGGLRRLWASPLRRRHRTAC